MGKQYKLAGKYYVIEPLNLSDFNVKLIEAFSSWQLGIRLYLGSPKSRN